MKLDLIQSIVTLSDVSVGYGTPQVLSISQSLAELTHASCLVLEPDQPERPPIAADIGGLTVERLYTANHPYTLSGQAEYCIQAAEKIDSEKPDLVVLCSFLGAGALLRMRHRPKLVIYYALEHTDGVRVRERRIFNQIAPLIDVVVFPEEMRAQLDAPRLGLAQKPSAIVYNGSSAPVQPLHWSKRNGRIFYGGLIHPTLTYGDYFLRGALDAYSIDLYGLIDEYDDPDEAVAGLTDRQSRVSFNGYAPGGTSFLSLLREYTYSIVIWSPHKESTLYAAPNKLFDAIQAGVPPISAPHPLCKRLVQRYKCGILMNDWSAEAVVESLDAASRLFFSGEYAEMVEARLPIARAELSWARQFEKLVHLVENLPEKAGRPRSLGKSGSGKPVIAAV